MAVRWVAVTNRTVPAGRRDRLVAPAPTDYNLRVDPSSPSETPQQSALTDPAAADLGIDPAEIDALEADLDAVDAVVAEMDRVLAEHAEEPERAAAAIDALSRRLTERNGADVAVDGSDLTGDGSKIVAE